MKRIITITILLFASAIAANAQQVCVDQSVINRCASTAQELIEARNVIAEFQKERALSQTEREKAATVIAGMNELLAVKDRIIASYEQINALKDSVIRLQMEIIEKQSARLLKGKSGFQRFLTALKEIAYFAGGIMLGRGL